ncbi:dihydrolipoamide acetyltransferase family protein [Rhodoluna lacicola]|uniref:dihydrolipoamide acetyltransferase family protein n=1 Tax=Rhodoluna lacicola TaxID=529884 RepID=UPI0022310F8E|nr:dihydrolipoamide acetyltransferase family protein [Rhodoluna lacicola]BDS49878.1 dihydrolipoyllysine-residue acetyltransferase component of pyruvate dehydrogenase complex [Rhodoluna lacicola]
MATLIRMPEVAAGATEIVLSKWNVAVGASVKVGDIIAEMETEKAVVDYASDAEGTVYKILVADGASVEVGSPIIILLGAGEDGSAGDALIGGSAAAPAAAAAPVAAAPIAPAAPAAPVAPPVAPIAPVDNGRSFVSPIVRKIARERGVEISQIVGTGPQGRVVRRDLEAFIASGAVATPTATPTLSASSELAKQEYSSSYVTVPHTGMRRAIARRLTESKSTVPHFYVTADCKVDALLELRKSINESSPVKISVNDIVVKAVASALMDVPESNVVWNAEAMHKYESADIAVAVTTDGGLLTPVIRGVEKRSLSNLSMEISELAGRARAGKLRQEELEGGSFAVSNLGMFGTKEFTAILNPPQSGILAVGAASPRAIVEDGQIVVANIMTVTLSADHRAVDGALAAQWLAAFVKRIENPLSMLV